MSRLRSGFVVALLVAGAAVWPRFVAAQAVTGTISGTITDAQGQVIPGATVTVIAEATTESRDVVSDARGDFQVTNLQPGKYTVRVALQSFRTLERKNIVLSAGERIAVGQPGRSRSAASGETIVVEARGTHVNTAETQHSGLITATQIEQVQVLGRDVTSIMRLLPGVRYENTGRFARHELRHVGAERRRCAARLEQRHRRRRGRQRGRRQQPDGAADQPRRDRGSARAAQLVSRRVRARGRRPGSDRQQGRHARRTTATSITTCETRRSTANNFFNNRSNIKKPRYRFNTFGANLGGPVPVLNKDEKKLFFFYSIEAPLVSRPGPVRNWTMPTDGRCRVTSRRRSTPRAG